MLDRIHPTFIVLLAQFLLVVQAAGDWTPLHEAARHGDLATAQRLLDEGAYVDVRGFDGETPLHEAADAGHRDLAELLLDRGADVNAKSGTKRTPLTRAAWEGWTDVAELLIERGADINVSGFVGRTPLHNAAATMHLEMVALLLKNGADIDARNDDGLTPLLYGFSLASNKIEEYSPVAELLIAEGADVDGVLHITATWGFYRVTELLIEKGADLDARDGRGFTPLHGAASLGRFETAELLIKAGADIHARSDLGFTPLHRAAQGGNVRLVELLLEMGADVNAAAEDGRTPLNFALQFSNRDVVYLLREHKAEKLHRCMTAADIEEMNQASRIRRLFVLHGVDAQVFLALDPRLLEFADAFDLLMEQDIDEIVAWRFSRPAVLGAAVPFSGGCVVDGYGEPDMIDKIKLMEDVLRLINKRGPDDERVRSRMKGLWKYEGPLAKDELEAEIDALLDRVRSLLEAE